MTARRSASLVFVVALGALGGCATVTVPAKVKVAVAQSEGPAVPVIDARQPAARVYREDSTGSYVSKYFGDDTFDPTIAAALTRKLADALPATMRHAKVELRLADVGFYATMGFGSPPSPFFSPGAPATGNVIGNLLGLGIVQGIRRASASEYAVAHIAVAVDGEVVSASQTVAIAGLKPEDAVSTAVNRALDAVAERVAALRPAASN